MLLAGPPGLGKTSLAQIVAAELEVDFVQTAGPALERKADIAAFLTALEPRSVFFVDEIHRLPRAVEETFYPAMEDSQLPITVGAGAGARVVTLELPPFTLIGATTRAGLLSTPLRDRFGLQHRLEHYGPGDLARIVVRSARVLGIEIESAGARAIAERARGTPRVANRLLKRVRDFAEVHRGGRIDAETASAALDMLEVDHEGLDRLDREILSAICGHFGGGPVGLSTLAVAVGEEQDTIEDVYEPYLLQRGLLKRTPRGRCATERAYRHLGLQPPPRPRASSRFDARVISILLRLPPEMAHLFICPNCGHRSTATERTAGFRSTPKGCSKCGFGFLFELLDDYYPAPNAAFFVCDQQGRIIACGRGSRELTGLSDEKVIGRPVSEVLGLDFDDGDDDVATVLEWGVRQLGKGVTVNAEGDIPAKAVADLFPAYDDDGGLLVLTPSK